MAKRAKRKTSGKPPGRDLPLPLVSRFQVAECLGAGPTSVARWEREGLPVAERGAGGRASKYSLPAVVRWYVAHERAKYETTAGVLNLDAERARFARAQTRRADLENRRREGELIPVAEIVVVWGEILATLRTSLRALAVALAVELVALVLRTPEGRERAVEQLLRDRIDAALRELAAWRPAVAPEASA